VIIERAAGLIDRLAKRIEDTVLPRAPDPAPASADQSRRRSAGGLRLRAAWRERLGGARELLEAALAAQLRERRERGGVGGGSQRRSGQLQAREVDARGLERQAREPLA
jgi:hypothetical protein